MNTKSFLGLKNLSFPRIMLILGKLQQTARQIDRYAVIISGYNGNVMSAKSNNNELDEFSLDKLVSDIRKEKSAQKC